MRRGRDRPDPGHPAGSDRREEAGSHPGGGLDFYSVRERLCLTVPLSFSLSESLTFGGKSYPQSRH